MTRFDVLQWFGLLAIAAGCWLISPRVGLIAAGILLIIGSTARELQAAARKRHDVREAP